MKRNGATMTPEKPTTMLYKHPGMNIADMAEGKISYEYIVVCDDSVDEMLAAGWRRTVTEAVELTKSSTKKQQPKNEEQTLSARAKERVDLTEALNPKPKG